jgi:four helix bundle protein
MSVGRFQGDLPQRTFEFAIAVIDLVDAIPEGTKGWVIGKQLARSGTSIGANICEADQALTEAEFAHRCSIARKESAETSYWLRLCKRTGLLSAQEVESCLQECAELSRILSTIVKKCQQHALVNS